jgi:hypothetical protein
VGNLRSIASRLHDLLPSSDLKLLGQKQAALR